MTTALAKMSLPRRVIDLTRSRRQKGAIYYAFLQPNPELCWEGGGETPHSTPMMSGFGFSYKQAARHPPSLTRENADDSVAHFRDNFAESAVTEANRRILHSLL